MRLSGITPTLLDTPELPVDGSGQVCPLVHHGPGLTRVQIGAGLTQAGELGAKVGGREAAATHHAGTSIPPRWSLGRSI